jgi:hypothetical protein
MIYNESLYGENLYFTPQVIGTWKRSFQFDYLSGATVLITPVMVFDQPTGTQVILLAGEDQNDLQVINPGVRQPVLFLSDTTGLTNIYFEIQLITTDPALTPSVQSLDVLIEQEASLYTVAKQVLVDGLSPSNTDYYIDPWLQNVLLPFSWLSRQPHRSALKQIGEACGGVTYSDRNGVVRIESGQYTNGQTIVDHINEDRILDTQSPVSTVINRVDITTSPYVALAEQTVWEIEGVVMAEVGDILEYEAFFSDYKAVFEASASVIGAMILEETFYTWGGRFKIQATDTSVTVAVLGRPLVVRGAQTISRSNGASIRRNSERQLSITENVLIQETDIAAIVANSIVDVSSNERRDIELTWRGDPTLTIGDRVRVIGQDAAIVEQNFRFNGALESRSRLVRI